MASPLLPGKGCVYVTLRGNMWVMMWQEVTPGRRGEAKRLSAWEIAAKWKFCYSFDIHVNLWHNHHHQDTESIHNPSNVLTHPVPPQSPADLPFCYYWLVCNFSHFLQMKPYSIPSSLFVFSLQVILRFIYTTVCLSSWFIFSVNIMYGYSTVYPLNWGWTFGDFQCGAIISNTAMNMSTNLCRLSFLMNKYLEWNVWLRQ